MCHDTCTHPVSGGDHWDGQDLALPVGDGELPLFLVSPDRLPAPAVMIIHDIHGPNDFYRDLARRIAGAGFLVALPDFFFRQEPIPAGDAPAARERSRQVDQAKTFDDIETTLIWLRDDERSTGRLGVIGMCWGGSLTMLAASRTPAPDAVVPFYGFPVRERLPNFAILPIDESEVTGITAPMLAIWGDDDTAVGMENVRAYEEKMQKYEKPYEFVIYPGVGHAFLTFDPASDAREASADAWQKTLAFLGRQLELPGSAA